MGAKMEPSHSFTIQLFDGHGYEEYGGGEEINWSTEAGKAASYLQTKLAWIGIFNYMTPWRRTKTVLSALLFCVPGIAVPLLVCTLVVCTGCTPSQKHPFQNVLQASETTISMLSFVCLLFLVRKMGLPELLLQNDVSIYDSTAVQRGYTHELKHIWRRLFIVLLPFLIVKIVHSIMWFIDAQVYLGGDIGGDTGAIVKKVVMCCLWIASWVFNNSTFLLMCFFFRLVCVLQVLRLQSYYQLMDGRGSSSVLIMLQEHMRLRQQLLLISLRFRLFLLLTLFAITVSHFAMLFMVTDSDFTLSFSSTGDLVICCALQLVGFILCLHAAAKITHMAQHIVSVVSQWHAVATCVDDIEDDVEVTERIVAPEILAQMQGGRNRNHARSPSAFHFDIPRPLVHKETYVDEESELAGTLQLLASTTDILSTSGAFRKRSALVAYMQHCCAGISLYGFVLDRGSLYTIFALELSLVMWTLGKTVDSD